MHSVLLPSARLLNWRRLHIFEKSHLSPSFEILEVQSMSCTNCQALNLKFPRT